MKSFCATALCLALLVPAPLCAQDVKLEGGPIYSVEELVPHSWTNPYWYCVHLSVDAQHRYTVAPKGKRVIQGVAEIDPDGTLRLQEAGTINLILLRRKDNVALCGKTWHPGLFGGRAVSDICFYNDRTC